MMSLEEKLTKIKTAPIQIVELKYQHIDPRGKQRAKKTIHQQTDSEANEKETRERGKKSNLNDEEKSSLESTSESAEPSSTSPAYIPHSSPAFLEKCFGSLRNAHSLKEVHDTAKFIFDRMRAFDTHEFGYLYLEPYPPLDDVTTMKNPIQQTPPTKSISDRYSLGPLSPLPCIAHVVLREKKRTGLNVGVTHSTTHNETVLETQLMLRNVFGNGEKLTGDITYSLTKSSAFQLHFSKPLLHWGWDKWADFEIFQQTTNNMLHSSHVEKKRGIALRYSFGRHSLSYEWSWRRIQLGTHATEGLLKEGGHNVKSSLIHRYFIDTRDDSLLPTEGFAFRFMQELAGIGGDVKFLKHEVDTQLNWPITTPGGAAINVLLKGGTHIPLWGSMSRISDRFFLGGATSFRGFESKGVGPRFRKDAYGGDVFYLASLHLSIPLPLKLSLGKFRTHLFAQAGNLLQLYRTSEFSSSSSSTAQHSSQRQQEGATTTNFLNELVSTTRASVGAGLIMRTSFGLRVELNYAIPILTQPTDHTQNLQLGVAFEFI